MNRLSQNLYMQQSEEIEKEDRSQILSELESKLIQVDGKLNQAKTKTQTRNIEIIVNPWLKQYILLGYGAKGAIYFLIGILAIEAAILPERQAAGTYNALKHLSGQPLGSIMLCLLAIGILGYVLRRLLQAVIYPGQTQNFKLFSIFQRLGYLVSSVSYAGVAYSAISIVFHLGKYNNRIQTGVEHLLHHVIAGEAIVFMAGLGVMGVGIGYIYGARTGSYLSQFASVEIDYRFEYCAKWLGKIGIAARGVSFVVSGICLILASLSLDSHLAGGVQKAFRTLSEQPLGWLWLSLIGAGFIAYGIYLFIAARYRRYAIR
ncbi:MAG: DUF1206 domain-containing protein [Cyanobacteria bacterium J06600_6]